MGWVGGGVGIFARMKRTFFFFVFFDLILVSADDSGLHRGTGRATGEVVLCANNARVDESRFCRECVSREHVLTVFERDFDHFRM